MFLELARTHIHDKLQVQMFEEHWSILVWLNFTTFSLGHWFLHRNNRTPHCLTPSNSHNVTLSGWVPGDGWWQESR